MRVLSCMQWCHLEEPCKWLQMTTVQIKAYKHCRKRLGRAITHPMISIKIPNKYTRQMVVAEDRGKTFQARTSGPGTTTDITSLCTMFFLFADYLINLFLDSMSLVNLAIIIPSMQSCWHYCLEGFNITSSSIQIKQSNREITGCHLMGKVS